MHHRHPFENRYCSGCQCTTRHVVKEVTYCCLRCGVVKYPTHTVKQVLSVLPLTDGLALGQNCA